MTPEKRVKPNLVYPDSEEDREDEELEEEEEKEKSRLSGAVKFLIALAVLIMVGTIIWYLGCDNWGWDIKPWDLGTVSSRLFGTATTSEPTAEPSPTPVAAAPAATSEPANPTQPPEKEEPTQPPEKEEPTAPPTTGYEEEDITEEDSEEALATTAPQYILGDIKVKVPLIDEAGKPVTQNGKQVEDYTNRIYFQVNGEWVFLWTFSYHGGCDPANDPTLSADKPDDRAYGPKTYGNTYQEIVYNDLRDDCRSVHRLIHLREQTGLTKKLSLAEENRLAEELTAKPADEYDAFVNETLAAVYKWLYGGRMEILTKNFDLINIIAKGEGPDETVVSELHGLEQSFQLKEGEFIYTLYSAGAEKTFVSKHQGFQNTYDDAKASGKYSTRAYRYPAWGGNWVWLRKGNGGTPTSGPTATPALTDAPTSTPSPTPTARPTKSPPDRPQVSDAPIGGGETNPENSEDPYREDHTESTPTPAVATSTPSPPPSPTPTPTAVVRPTEQCEATTSPLVHEDTDSHSDDGQTHNVDQTETEGQGGDYDLGSI